jgi:Tfp pilus assembly protein PilO
MWIVVTIVLLGVAGLAIAQMWLLHILSERIEMLKDENAEQTIAYERRLFEQEYDRATRCSQLQQELDYAHQNIEFLLTQIPKKEEI